MQTLCILHCHNRRGPNSWYPSELLAPANRKHRRRAGGAKGNSRRASNGDLDILR